MKKFARKVGRSAKAACQFRFTCTFEYIDLTCVDGWVPENLHVVWLRGHRRAESPDVKWVAKSDMGKTRDGRATFDPPIASSLIVTLYQQKDGHDFDQKDYKFFIENEGENGKKILASFTCNLGDFAGIPSEKHTLDMTFKPVSKKIDKALLGLTLESEFIKKGKASDDDMMSTFSRVSGNMEGDDVPEDEDDEDDPTASTSSFQKVSVSDVKPPDDIKPPEASLASIATASEPKPDVADSDTSLTQSLMPNFVTGPKLDGPCWLPDDLALIDVNSQPVPKSKLDQTDVIGLYFSAKWCTPCKKFLPKLQKFYNFLKEQDRSFEIVYVSSDNSKELMLEYMVEMQMPWSAIDFDSPLGEKLRSDFKVSAIPLLCIVSRNGEVISENSKKAVDTASSGTTEITRLYNKWIRKLLEIKGLPVPDEEEVEKKKGFLGSLFGGGKKKDKKQESQAEDQPPAGATVNGDHVSEPPPASKHKKDLEEVARQKAQLERERSKDRQVVEEKTRKLHVTLELNAQMQRELEEKDEKIRALEAKNETLRQTADSKTEMVEELKQQIAMLEEQVSSKAAEERKMQDERRQLLANISLHGWLFKRGIKGPTANSWRRRYFRIEEGHKLTYYKTAGEGPPQGFVDMDHVLSVNVLPGAQQDKNQCTFHIVTQGRTYELQAHDEPTMKKWVSSIEYMKQWREKQKRESNTE